MATLRVSRSRSRGARTARSSGACARERLPSARPSLTS